MHSRNSRALARQFDQDYRSIGIADSKQDLKLGFGYDPVGDLVDLASGDTQIKLQYDALGRLTHFKDAPSGATIDQYTYDATGNRTSFSNAAGTVPYGYPADSHRLTSVGGELRTYDAMGNTTSIGGTDREFVYDERGRMAQVKRSGAVAPGYLYNAKGEQVARLGGAGAGLLLYDEVGHSLGGYDAAGLSGQQVIWMDDAPVGLLEGGALSYVEPDHLGTPRLVADPVRDVAVWGWDLKGEAFGSNLPNEDLDQNGATQSFDVRFPGQRIVLAAGVNYNLFRDFDPSAGRYIESDPVGLAAGPSTYGYAMASPFSHLDRDGLASCYYAISAQRLVCYPDSGAQSLSIPVASGNNGGGLRCKDNPDCTNISSRGPIPTGLWVWTDEYTSKKNGRALAPLPGTETFGRSLIRSHSCANPFGPSLGLKFCSEGCVTGRSPDIEALNALIDSEPGSTLRVMDQFYPRPPISFW